MVPPFAGLDRPALGPHLLQAVARDEGFEVTVFYANITFARVLGEPLYHRICYSSSTMLAGERVFAHLAFGVPRLGNRRPGDEVFFKGTVAERQPAVTLEELEHASAVATAWLPDVAAEILALGSDIVGCSTTFEQTAASVALLRRLKESRPEIVTLLGGANCEGEMGDRLASLVPEIDYTFVGECEGVFPEFLRDISAQRRPSARLVHGTPCGDMDALPCVDYSEYYKRLESVADFHFVREKEVRLPYESSRGCWWGEKQHCLFCGMNAETIRFRRKDPARVVSDLTVLLGAHPSKRISMVDNIMPYEFFKTLLPALAQSDLQAHIFYEQKANLNLHQVKLLREAGVAVIQPGIEALSTPLLRLMRKGVSAAQNIRLLRYCRSCDIAVNWNLLYAFPQDRLAWYEETLRLLPLLRHLHPPSGLSHLSLDRFSPYHDNPGAFGISAVAPIDAYLDVLPRDADVAHIAYHFTAQYESESRDEVRVMTAIRDEISAWRLAWQGVAAAGAPVEALAAASAGAESAAMLVVTRLDDSTFLLTDSRRGGGPTFEFLDEAQARLVLLGAANGAEPSLRWAAKRGWITCVDDRWIALATADYELMEYFEASQTVAGSR